MKDYAEIIRSYVPNGDGYNSEYAHDLSEAADEIERLLRVERAARQLCDENSTATWREDYAALKAALEEK